MRVTKKFLALLYLLGFVLNCIRASDAAGISINVGEYVYFGRYDHVINGDTGTREGKQRPILWEKKSESLYLSVYLVDRQPWGSPYPTKVLDWVSSDTTHTPSTLRPWLNTEAGGFFETAFTAGEQAVLNKGVDGDGDLFTGAQVTVPPAGSGGSSLYGSAKYPGATSNSDYWTRSPLDGGHAWYVSSGGGEDGATAPATVWECAPL